MKKISFLLLALLPATPQISFCMASFLTAPRDTDYTRGGKPGFLYDRRGEVIAMYAPTGELAAEHFDPAKKLVKVLYKAHRDKEGNWYDMRRQCVATVTKPGFPLSEIIPPSLLTEIFSYYFDTSSATDFIESILLIPFAQKNNWTHITHAALVALKIHMQELSIEKAVDADGSNIFHIALQKKIPLFLLQALLKAITNKRRLLITARNAGFETPLHIAARLHTKDAFKLVLSHIPITYKKTLLNRLATATNSDLTKIADRIGKVFAMEGPPIYAQIRHGPSGVKTLPSATRMPAIPAAISKQSQPSEKKSAKEKASSVSLPRIHQPPPQARAVPAQPPRQPVQPKKQLSDKSGLLPLIPRAQDRSRPPTHSASTPILGRSQFRTPLPPIISALSASGSSSGFAR